MSAQEPGGAVDVEAIGRAIADRVAERLRGFEDRISGIEEDLAAHIDRMRASAQDFDLLSDEVRKALQDHDGDGEVAARLSSIESRLQERPEPTGAVDLGHVSAAIDDLRSHVDLSSIRNGLAEVIDALAHQVDDTRSTNASTLAAIEVVADRIEDNRVDLEPLHQRLAALPDTAHLDELRSHIDAIRTHVDAGRVDLTPLTERLDTLGQTVRERTDQTPLLERLDTLATQIEAARPEPADLGPVTAAIADLRTHIADSRVDLQPLHAQVDALGQTVAERTDQAPLLDRLDDLRSPVDLSSIRAGIAEVIEASAVQLEATERTSSQIADAIATTAAVGAAEVDLGPVVGAVEALRQHYDATQPDLNALIEAMKSLRTQIVETVQEAGTANRVDLAPVVDELAEQRAGADAVADQLRSELTRLADAVREAREAARASSERIETTLAPTPVDLDPLLEAVAQLREAIPTLDLQPLHNHLSEVAEAIPSLDLGSVHAALEDLGRQIPEAPDLASIHARLVDVAASIPPATDLDPVHADLGAMRDAIAALELQPIHDHLNELRRSMPTVDFTPVTEAIESVHRDLPTVDLDPVNQALAGMREQVDGIELDTDPIREEISALRATITAAQTDLTPVLDALAGTRSEMARSEMARSESLDQLGQRLDAVQSAVESMRADDAVHQAELRLARRVDTNSEALREKIDDQRVLADNLAANVSQLNAALTVASEEPQQLRRDLDRILEQLAERMGNAMRELRHELDSAEEPRALRSSVEAGLDRITGRFQNDTGRILEAVAAAQEDADGRLRRIDNQVTELRRAVERARRDAEHFERAPSS